MKCCAGQALLELAVFGSLTLLVLGALINYSLNADVTQQARMLAFRQALASATKAPLDGQPTSVTHLLVQDHHVPNPSSPFAVGSVLPINPESQGVTRHHKLQELATIAEELPRMRLMVQGQEVDCPGLTPGPGCTTAGFRIERDVPPESLERYFEIYGRSHVCDKEECGGGDGECLEEEFIPGPLGGGTGEVLCVKYAKRLKIVDRCEGELIGYDDCVRQARQIVDDGVCLQLCEKGKFPGSRTDCQDICARQIPPENVPWYARGGTEAPGSHEDGTHRWTFPNLNALFAGIPALGLQRDYVKATRMDNQLEREDEDEEEEEEREKEEDGISTTHDTVDAQDTFTRTILFNDGLDGQGVSQGLVKRESLEVKDAVCVTSCAPGDGCPSGFLVTSVDGTGSCPSPQPKTWQTRMSADEPTQ